MEGGLIHVRLASINNTGEHHLKRAIFMSLLAVALCSGCTAFVRTNATSHSTANEVPTDRMLAYSEQKEGYASMTVTRDEGFMGGGCYLGLVISGTIAARFDPKETATFFIPPGETSMAVVPDPQRKGLCSVGGWDPVPEKYDIKIGATNLYRISLGAYRRPRLLPSVY